MPGLGEVQMHFDLRAGSSMAFHNMYPGAYREASLQRRQRRSCSRKYEVISKSFLNARKKDQPFAYWFGPTNVHRKWTKGSGKKLWNIDPDHLPRAKCLPSCQMSTLSARTPADYLGEIAAFDAGLGLLIDELKKAGEYDNTLIVVSGDHGPPGFPHGKCNPMTSALGSALPSLDLV